jgi:hypothetical protein
MFKLCKGKKGRGGDYIIRAALREEMNDGWVWLDGFPSRTVIEIKNLNTGCSVICQARKLDDNYIEHYNSDQGRLRIGMGDNIIVMSGWYREALGISETTKDDISKATLVVCPYEGWWGHLCAACHHPDIVVRLGTRLGALGAWLGLLGAVLGALSLVQADGCGRWLFCGIGVILILLAAFLWGVLSWPRNAK